MLKANLKTCASAKPFTTGPPTVKRRSMHTHRSSLSRSNGLEQERFVRRATALSQDRRRPWLQRPRRTKQSTVSASAAPDPLVPLGLDFLTFLAATVLVIPLFKSVKASPVLGFLFSGLLLGQLGYDLTFTCTVSLMQKHENDETIAELCFATGFSAT